MSRSFSFLALLGAIVWTWGGAAKATDAKTQLVHEAVVRGSSIYLSDLLPESCPNPLRAAAEKVLVGVAPEPGGVRVLSNAKVVGLLNDRNLVGQIDVPDQITIHRSGHQITREEVAEAIHRASVRDESLRTAQITPAAIRLSARLMIAANDPDLRVTRIQTDRALHQTKFWLVSKSDPALSPFMVTVSTADKLSPDYEERQPSDTNGVPSKRALGPTANSASALVQAGQLVRLHLVSGAATQMYLNATSLERGDLNQTVRVKIQSTGKVLSAHVVGRARLEAEL